MTTNNITIYSADWCGYCHAVKNYLDGLGVEFTEKNIEQDQAYAQESVEKSGQMGIPVVDIDGTIIVGFDRQTIDHTLRSKNLIS